MNYGIGIKSRLQGVKIAYVFIFTRAGHVERAVLFSHQEQIEKTDRLRDEIVKAITKNTEEIYEFKTLVSQSLDELCMFAESN
jgi:hypothetical protein